MPNLKCIAYEVVRFEGYEVVRRTLPRPSAREGSIRSGSPGYYYYVSGKKLYRFPLGGVRDGSTISPLPPS
jgi:hypothetical protein